MAAEIPSVQLQSVAEFSQQLQLSDAEHMYIKASISMAANEVLPPPQDGQAIELLGVPFTNVFTPEGVVDKIGGPCWSTMDICLPDLPPATCLDRLPLGTVIQLHDTQTERTLTIRRSKQEAPLYNSTLGSTRKDTKPTFGLYQNLTEDDVIALLTSGLELDGFGMGIASPQEARQLFVDIHNLHPALPRRWVHDRHQKLQLPESLGFNGLAAIAKLRRIHTYAATWRQPQELFTFAGELPSIPIALNDSESDFGHECTASSTVTYSFSKLYSRSLKDIQAGINIKFASSVPPTADINGQYAELINETRLERQLSLPRYVSHALGVMIMNYRDKQ